jgi:ADP-ribose pyrophosphatase YjhB (NUDIX family)
LPGGHLNIGERVDDAIRREILEEIGMKVEPLCPWLTNINESISEVYLS